MPRETYSTTPVSVNTDLPTRDRITALVPIVQAEYLAYELRTYGSNLPPDVDEAYVKMGAVNVGLNRLPPAPATVRAPYMTPTAATFPLQRGETVLAITVDVEASDLARAQAWATALSVPLARVLGACLCTGVAALSGIDEAGRPAALPAIGPFGTVEPLVDPLVATPPFTGPFKLGVTPLSATTVGRLNFPPQ